MHVWTCQGFCSVGVSVGGGGGGGVSVGVGVGIGGGGVGVDVSGGGGGGNSPISTLLPRLVSRRRWSRPLKKLCFPLSLTCNPQVLRDVLAILAQPPSFRTPTAGTSAGGAGGSSRARVGGRCGRGFPLALMALASVRLSARLEWDLCRGCSFYS